MKTKKMNLLKIYRYLYTKIYVIIYHKTYFFYNRNRLNKTFFPIQNDIVFRLNIYDYIVLNYMFVFCSGIIPVFLGKQDISYFVTIYVALSMFFYCGINLFKDYVNK